ncbi:MAG: endo-1,4-beta-xylanase, partial [Treponema sp.]|nr:endo-1,4-beta-xylanase [Treponema sp.]
SGNLTPPADCVVTRMIIQNNTSLCDFYIDDIKIELKSGTPESAAIQESLLGIKDAPLFNSKNLLIGAGIGNTVLQDPHGNRQALAAKHFNSIAISNSFKPQYILDYPASVGNLALYNDHAAVYFDITKDYFNFAVTNNMKMSAQALLWYQLTPEWFFHVNYNTAQPLADRDLMLKRMENYIKDVLTWCQTNYPGMFKMWVVCNESIDPTTAVDTATSNPYQVRNDNWYKTVGPDYIAQAFAFAQKYKTDPELDLVYNDYNLESSTAANSKFNQVLNYINYYDVQLDGIAFQMHVQLAANSPAVATIKTNIEKIKNDSRVSAKNLSAYISEMDVKADSNDAATMQSLSDRYNTIISTVLGADTRLKGITWWCLTDGYSWLTPNAGKAMYPLMFDINNQAKPAYYGVMQAGGASVSP